MISNNADVFSMAICERLAGYIQNTQILQSADFSGLPLQEQNMGVKSDGAQKKRKISADRKFFKAVGMNDTLTELKLDYCMLERRQIEALSVNGLAKSGTIIDVSLRGNDLDDKCCEAVNS